MADRLAERVPAAASRSTGLGDLRALYEEHADFLYRAILRLGGPRLAPADAEDLLQEVFVVALRKGASFEGRSQARTWLYGVAVRVVIGARRRHALRRLVGLGDAPAGAEPVEPSTPESLSSAREAHDLLYRALDRLPAKKRTVLVLFEIEGLSGEEIAEIVGCPLKTVWTRLYHARRDLLRELGRLGAGELAAAGAALSSQGRSS